MLNAIWMEELSKSFDNFTDFVCVRLETAITQSIVETLRLKLQDPKSEGVAELNTAIGKFIATVRTKDGQDNVNFTLEFNKDAEKMVNGDIDTCWLEEYDELYLKKMAEFTAYGVFDPESEENRKAIEAAGGKCLNLKPEERLFFPNSYFNTIIATMRDKTRDGKIYNLDINDGWDLGTVTVETNDGKSSLSFTASKQSKQYLKSSVIEGL